MSKRRISEHENLEKTVLTVLLNKGPLTYSQLYKEVLKACGTPATFRTIFSHLKATGRVAKTSNRHRAPYVITEKGKHFLEGLK